MQFNKIEQQRKVRKQKNHRNARYKGLRKKWHKVTLNKTRLMAALNNINALDDLKRKKA